jgi:3-mercaptopropionate dioxygenase
MADIDKLQQFVREMTRLVDSGADEASLLAGARDAMRTLVSVDDWLPEELAKPHAQHYQQYLLHRDPAGRFSVVSFVWGPGQRTPVHDHTVWGVIGMLRGAEVAVSYAYDGPRLVERDEIRLQPGDVEAVSPTVGDIHRVSNAHDDRVSISVHCYGADIGQVRRHVYDLESGASKEFVSGYANV